MISSNEKLLAAAGHLGYLAALPIVLPLIIYVWQRDKSQFVAEQTKQAILLHLVSLVLGVLAFGVTFFTFGLGAMVVVPAALLYGLVTVVLTVYAVIQVGDGKHYRYPIIGGLLDGF